MPNVRSKCESMRPVLVVSMWDLGSWQPTMSTQPPSMTAHSTQGPYVTPSMRMFRVVARQLFRSHTRGTIVSRTTSGFIPGMVHPLIPFVMPMGRTYPWKLVNKGKVLMWDLGHDNSQIQFFEGYTPRCRQIYKRPLGLNHITSIKFLLNHQP